MRIADWLEKIIPLPMAMYQVETIYNKIRQIHWYSVGRIAL